MEEQSNEALWYVVHTYSGYENKVATDLQTMVENRRLQDLICDIKVPTEMVPEIKDGKERMVEHKLFPGYVLVKMVMNDDTWYVVRNTRGCTGFVGPASKPVPLTAEEVEKMGVSGDRLEIFAYKGEAPAEDSPLFLAPFFNVTGSSVCLGNASLIPPENMTFSKLLEYWEKRFWLSEFSHLGGSRNPT